MSAPSFFRRDDAGRLCVSGTPLEDIAAEVGTPLYVYSREAVEQAATGWQQAFAGCRHQLCYSVKANSNLTLLRLLAEAGWDFDIVSGGELDRLSAISVSAGRVRFSGVGKTRPELEQAVRSGIGAVHLESAGEAELLADIAAAENRSVPVAVRVNPDTQAGGHRGVSTARAGDKFGVPLAEAEELYNYLQQDTQLRPTGVAFHLGSQIVEPTPYLEAIDKVLPLIEALRARGMQIDELDIGGGCAVVTEGGRELSPAELAQAVLPSIARADLKLVMSPGRALVADAGVLLTHVLYCKQMGGRRIAIVDGAMNDYIRPALYGIEPQVEAVQNQDQGQGEAVVCDIAGPVCESTDFLAREASIPFRQGALLALMGTGAYGAAMASNYNSRPRPAEVLAGPDGWRLIRRRDTLDDLLAAERES